MPRKKVYSTVVPVIVRMEARLLELVDEVSEREGVSRNSLVTSILAAQFNELGLAHREIWHLPRNTDETIRKGQETARESELRSAASFKAQNAVLRKKIVEAYGGRCTCCGESRLRFLTIDHVNGPDGRRGSRLLRYIVRHRFPPQYRILCFNCNSGRALNGGVCPHQSA